MRNIFLVNIEKKKNYWQLGHFSTHCNDAPNMSFISNAIANVKHRDIQGYMTKNESTQTDFG